jgi:acyl-coenzyme A thioesterase PaaI-like protein
MTQGSQLGANSTIAGASKPHPMLRDFFEHGPGQPLRLAGPLATQLKGELLDVDLANGSVLAAFQPGEAFTQGVGVIQGGIVTAMLDYAMALCGFTRIAKGKTFGTVSMTTQFLKPVTPGRWLARGRLDRAGARMIYASAELRADGSDALAATACAVMAITDL